MESMATKHDGLIIARAIQEIGFILDELNLKVEHLLKQNRNE